MEVTFGEIILLCIYFPLALWFVKYFSKKVDPELRTYFEKGLKYKLYASVFLGLVYIYIFGGGDTTNYFVHSRFLTSQIFQSPQNIFKYLFANEDDFYRYFSFYIDQQFNSTAYFRTANMTVIKIASVCNFFTFSSFFGTGFIFCFFAYWGEWKIFKVFYHAYPDIGTKFAYSLFIPSVLFWSSGILKDSLCLGAIGGIIYIADTITFKKADVLKILVFIILCYMVLLVKAYIIFCLIIPLIVWRFSIIVKKIGVGIFAKPYFWFCTFGSIIIYKIGNIKALVGDLSLESLYFNVITIRTSFEGSGDSDSSSFTLSDFSPSISGFLGQIPQALNATLFRPYVWESKKVFSLIAAGESLGILILTVYVIYKTGLITFIKIIFTNPDVLFCFLFTFLFAVSLGMTITNFGALVRFKIQFLPFLLIGLILIYYKKIDRNSGVEL